MDCGIIIVQELNKLYEHVTIILLNTTITYFRKCIHLLIIIFIKKYPFSRRNCVEDYRFC